MSRLDGKVAVVTGAASGNGRAMAVRFAELGADVVIADVETGGLEETARLVRSTGRKALEVACDVAKKSEIDRMIERTANELGRVDICVANAGVVEKETDCLRMTEQQWDRTIGVNLRGVFFTLQAGARRMIEQGGGGRLIAIASIMADWGAAGTPAYTASKGGVRQLVKSFAIACGRHGITCNAIAPGFIETGMTKMITDNPMLSAQLIDRTPVGRIGVAPDVAAVAAFLAGDEAGFVNGSTLICDGGITAGLYSAAGVAAMEAASR
jgi:glucose 1-dehydrogenase